MADNNLPFLDCGAEPAIQIGNPAKPLRVEPVDADPPIVVAQVAREAAGPAPAELVRRMRFDPPPLDDRPDLVLLPVEDRPPLVDRAALAVGPVWLGVLALRPCRRLLARSPVTTRIFLPWWACCALRSSRRMALA